MTKVTVLNVDSHDKKELKKIEFVKWATEFGEWADNKNCAQPYQWENIVLILRKWRDSNMDLMIAYDTNRNGILVLGHFNDGIV